MHKRIKIGELIKAKKAHSQTGPFGTQLKASEYVDEGFPVINVRNIGMGDIRADNLEYVNDEKALELKSHSLQENDIVFGRKGAVERHSFITINEQGWIQGSDCIRLRFLTDDYNPKFISYFFRTQSHQQWMINLGSFGATMGSLNQEIISKIEIPDLPRITQNQISFILSAYDDLIENNNQRIKLLEEMAEEIYKEWFVRMRFPGYKDSKFFDKDGNEVPHGTSNALPEGWVNSQLKNHLEYYRGKSYSSDELRDNEGIAMLNLKNVNRQGGFRLDGLKYLEGKYNTNNVAYSSDIIMAVTDMTQEREIVGRVARVPDMGIEKFIISMDLIRIEPLKLPKLFLYCFLRYSGIGFQLKEFANGANVLHLTPSIIEFQKGIIPEIKVCENFEEIISPMINEIDVLNKKNQVLQETRDLLLPRLISGKLSVEDVNLEDTNNLAMAAEPEVGYKN